MTPLPPSTHDTAQFLDYHVSMLRDTVRTNAFREAILATVAEGDVVVDIGCGTGILSLFACQAGARRVYAIDRGPVLDVARDLALDRRGVERGPRTLRQGIARHPTEPSISISISLLSSTAYSSGSCLAIGSMKPRTIIAIASSVLIPRLSR